jgi:outer membrane protein OmpA-like peptidoglycan-associated protein/uncharacterized protein YidB (DUF937 family)
MLDVLLKELATRLKLGDRASPLLTMLLSLIFDEKRGGFAGFTDRFRANNMGELLTSWLGNGENRALTLSQLESVLGNNVMQQIASRLDLSTGTVSTALGQLIPTVIDKLSPDGKLPVGSAIPESVRAYLTGEHAKFSQIAVLPEVQASKAAAHTLAHTHAPQKHNWAWLLLIPVLCAPLLFMRGCDKATVGTMPAAGVNQDGPVTIGELQPPGDVVIQSEPVKPKIVSDAPAPVAPIETIMTPAPAEAALDQLVLANTFTTAELTTALNLMVVYFDSGKSSIKDVSLPILQKAAAAISKAPAGTELVVTGHTDSRGPEPENVKLSLDRAQSVIAKLIELGVDIQSKKLTSKGLGSSEPVASNEDLAGRAKNRRIVFSVAQ